VKKAIADYTEAIKIEKKSIEKESKTAIEGVSQ